MPRFRFSFWIPIGVIMLVGCSFSFELTSQRTALENQIMGKYQELEDDVILISAVRGEKLAQAQPAAEKERALRARQMQAFNQDDLDEFKDRGVVGEKSNGRVAMLPPNYHREPKASRAELAIAASIVDEENKNRAIIWSFLISENDNLDAGDIDSVRKTYAGQQRDKGAANHFFEAEDGAWREKAGTPAQPNDE